jgi:D-3-phosphoglycerate dehydrogenase
MGLAMNIPILISTSQFDPHHFAIANSVTGGLLSPTYNTFGRRLTEEEISEQLSSGYVGLIAGLEPLTANVLIKAKGLRVIARVGTGLDSVDLTVAKRLGISVLNTPDATTDAVAELTIGHMLSSLRGITMTDRRIRSGEWSPYMGNLLKGKTVGIVGFGRIGHRVGQLVEAFGAAILIHDSRESLVSDPRWRDLESLCAGSDIVSLHTPLVEATQHLIGAKELSAMRCGAIILNVARGGLIDEHALAAALREGRIRAALDCFTNEPYQGELRTLDNVTMTAHMGSYASETRAVMEVEAASNLVAELQRLGVV